MEPIITDESAGKYRLVLQADGNLGTRRRDGKTIAALGADPEHPWNPTPSPTIRRGNTSIDGHLWRDEGGKFFAQGATFFSAIWLAGKDPQRLFDNLDYLQANDIHFIRILSNTDRANRVIDPYGWGLSSYFHRFDQLLSALEKRGMRAEVTLYPGGEMVEPDKRQTFLSQMAASCNAHSGQILCAEIANEFRNMGMKELELQTLTQQWADSSDIPILASAPEGYHSGRDNYERWRNNNWPISAYNPHLARQFGDVGRRYCRQGWPFVNTTWINHEPHPAEFPAFVAMDRAITQIASGSGIILHTQGFGVHDTTPYIWEEPNMDAIMSAQSSVHALFPAKLSEAPTFNTENEGHPFPDKNHSQRWPTTNKDGVVRNFCAGPVKIAGTETWFTAPLGLRGKYQVEPAWDMHVIVRPAHDVFDIVDEVDLFEGEPHSFVNPGEQVYGDYIFEVTEL